MVPLWVLSCGSPEKKGVEALFWPITSDNLEIANDRTPIIKDNSKVQLAKTGDIVLGPMTFPEYNIDTLYNFCAAGVALINVSDKTANITKISWGILTQDGKLTIREFGELTTRFRTIDGDGNWSKSMTIGSGRVVYECEEDTDGPAVGFPYYWFHGFATVEETKYRQYNICYDVEYYTESGTQKTDRTCLPCSR